MNENRDQQHKIDRLERQLKESNSVSSAIFSIFSSIIITMALGINNPLLVLVLFFVIYGLTKLIR